MCRRQLARHVRYAPDFLGVDSRNPDTAVYLLESKCTKTPLYSSRQSFTGLLTKLIGVHFRGKILDNVRAKLQTIMLRPTTLAIRVAILTYVAYHDRLLALFECDR